MLAINNKAYAREHKRNAKESQSLNREKKKMYKSRLKINRNVQNVWSYIVRVRCL